jgi:hypothetical protein
MNSFLIGCASILLFSNTVIADEIFKWVDEDGTTHYSSRNENQKARLAELPKLNRGDYKVGAVNGATCDKHGGINCQSGEDVDGSVICFDGFDGASARFKFHCSSPKLRISDISEPDTKGRVSVFIRNDRSVAARLPKVMYLAKDGAKIPLKGPTEVKEFQMAEFSFISGYIAQNRVKPDISQFTVSCDNCD